MRTIWLGGYWGHHAPRGGCAGSGGLFLCGWQWMWGDERRTGVRLPGALDDLRCRLTATGRPVPM
ncbi:hypothetical protein ALP36_103117 [Pseudomonas syringae pv. coriandricola]|uniref:Uncharacterized protein n=1 Tax=Pseudomonas syringae pv. coriandricola TaxID=264453 RepID=A0A3M5RL73_9PSED|nr:hypothetical protein ALP87_103015 [Pseudomonas syringae pv. coriandricola]RMU09749.1 hypothetical protein ALP36_103117 [Pseudomonas syringae pv. coriandricola]